MDAERAFQESLFADDEEEQENEQAADVGNPEFVVFLIDAGQDMLLTFDEEDGKQSYLEAVIDCVVANMKIRIISKDSDRVGVCFYNTRRKKNPQESEAVYVFKDTDRLSASFINDVSVLKESFEYEIGSKGVSRSNANDNPLYNAFWVAQTMLRSSTKNIIKTVHLFTNNDDPFGDADAAAQADMRRTTIQRIKDAQDLGIFIELHALNRPGEEFNTNIFYTNLVHASDDVDESRFIISESRSLKDLFDDMRKKVMKKRVTRRVSLTVRPGTEIGLQCFVMLRSAVAGATTWVDSQTNMEIKSERSFICADTGALMNEPIKRVQQIGSEKVIITPDELQQIKRTGVQLQLLGFKPLSTLKDYYNLQPSTFVYPDEQSISGSTAAFIALHRAMLKQSKYAVAFYGRMASPRLVALVPQEEILEGNSQLRPPGMHIIYLPYSDDIRPAEKFHMYSPGSTVRATAEQVQRASALIQKLKMTDFNLLDISNPVLQRHYAALQNVALDEANEVPEIVDRTLPDARGMAKPSVVSAVKAFKDDVYGADYDQVEAEMAAEKLKGSLASQKRKAVVEVAARAAEDQNWEELADSGKLKELTVVQLRPYLLAHNLPVSGKKELLISRILTHLGK